MLSPFVFYEECLITGIEVETNQVQLQSFTILELS